MMDFFRNFWRDKGASPSTLSGAERTALVDGALAAAEVLRRRNRVLSQQLSAHLAGNYRVTLNERPDGTAFFYGTFCDESAQSHRVEVMPPRDLWSGDFGMVRPALATLDHAKRKRQRNEQ